MYNCGLRVLSCVLAKGFEEALKLNKCKRDSSRKNLSGSHAERGVLRRPLEDQAISKPRLIEKPLIRKDGTVAPVLRK